MKRRPSLLVVGCLAAGLVAATAWAATVWRAVLGFSSIEFTAALDDGDFTGRFDRFDAGIVFDPADLAGSRFRVVVETDSADTRDSDRDAALKGPEFFHTARWPTATYEATRFIATGPGRFEARGRLTLRGVTRDLPVRFEFKPQDGEYASLTGEAVIRRLDFGVGQGDWQDTGSLRNDVRVRFGLVLKK